ncbi:unnamed protein product [Lactuca saligna]|uniref:Flavin-containing monooxygenase n=1 Tax=Lactuca saligna TaxID=75948 RepID=A0AA35V930_LACSI|nr:unnamed protein product [Lactuca saligna]
MNSRVEETVVIIVGAGPSGLATAACLYQLSIPYRILEREDCIASLFNKKSYHRLHLHLAKRLCHLPHFPFPESLPTYVSRADFLKYLDDYASHFNIKPIFGNLVQFAKYNEDRKRWNVEAKRIGGKNAEEEVEGLSDFKGEVIHSTEYKSGDIYEKKKVLVVGAGNSGMEIALDLANHGAKTSIVVRSPIHIVSRWSVNLGLMLLKFIPSYLVDSLLVLLIRDGKYPIINVGTFKNIKSREIQVLPALRSIKGGGNEVVFENGKCHQFDVILFATGFKRSTHLWLQGYDCLLKKDGLPKLIFPNHWKGENGLYCVGLARRGLYGAAMDAQNIADHIFNLISK